MEKLISKKDENLLGKSVLITGGTTGVGRATAVLLAKKGASVFIFGRHEKELNDAIADIRKGGGDAYGCTADVANYEDVLRVFEEFDDQLGKLDVLINNASIAGGSISETDYDKLLYSVEVNFVGYLLCTKLAYERMVKNKEGHIINIGSMSAQTRDEGTDLYTAAKSAIDGFSDSFRRKTNRENIKVTIIEPGNIGTDMLSEPPAEQEKLAKINVLLKAEDIAECIYYCLTQPQRVEVMRVQIKPSHQEM